MLLTNTNEFRREALKFKKLGYYTKAVPGSLEYMDYWREQRRRCIEGYSVGGVGITGEHYGYLNFGQIQLTPDDNKEGMVSKNYRGGRGRKKIRTFPDFWDGDRDYFWVKYIARWGLGSEDEDIAVVQKRFDDLGLASHIRIKPEHLFGGKHLAVAKARRKGYSFKNGWICAHQYNFEPNSTAVIGAYDKKYLFPEGTMGMASYYLDHLNKTTAWRKRRLVDKQDFKEAGYIQKVGGIDQRKGFRSKILAVSFRDQPGAARGKDAGLVLFEEAGRFPNLLDSIDATQDTMKDGIYMTGQMLIFGTGGGEDVNWEDFSILFNTPDLYDIIALENVLEEQAAPDTFISFFVPDTQNMKGYIDKDGNTQWKKAEAHWDREFERVKREAKSKNTVDNWLMEHARIPSHSFKGHTANIFPVAELKAWKAMVQSKKLYKNFGTAGHLYRSREDGVKFKPDVENLYPINHFPHKSTEDLEGAIVIYQHPQKIAGTDEVPEGLYYIAHDPYAFDTSTGVSLGATYVMKAVQNKYKPNDVIVACYHGRPGTQDEYNKNLFLLAEYYNCKIGFENDRGNTIEYAKNNHQLDLLEKEFDVSWNKELERKDVTRGYGINMTPKRKLQGMIYLRDWLLRKRGKDVKGNSVLNLHYIYDLATLEELIRYDPNPKKNFDRVSALLIAMYYEKELDYLEIKEALEAANNGQDPNNFFNDDIIEQFFN
jgi:hypothetical protein